MQTWLVVCGLGGLLVGGGKESTSMCVVVVKVQEKGLGDLLLFSDYLLSCLLSGRSTRYYHMG